MKEVLRTEVIVAAAITGAVTLAICLINNHYQAKQTRSLLDYRLQQLEKKQDRHNQVIERMYHVETEVEVIREQMKVANHRIGDLEEIKT